MSRRDRALVDNAADQKQVDNAKRVAKLTREEQLAEYRTVLATPEGARVLWRILERCRLHHVTDPSESDRLLWFREGERNIGTFLLHELEHARPDAYLAMRQAAQLPTPKPEETNDEVE